MTDEEIPLTGGNASSEVFRVGDTVRKPWARSSLSVHGYMSALRDRGSAVPESRGRDTLGRQVIEFVNGRLAIERVPMRRHELERVGQLVRDIHDASAGIALEGEWDVLLPVEAADLICHNDLAPWNLVLGERWVFIDWDGAGPSTRLWDLAYSASAFASLSEGESVAVASARLRAFVDGYGADDALRAALPDAMARRAQAMYDLLERSSKDDAQPWGRMFHEGHGDHWRSVTLYILNHREDWLSALTV